MPSGREAPADVPSSWVWASRPLGRVSSPEELVNGFLDALPPCESAFGAPVSLDPLLSSGKRCSYSF